MQPLFTVVMYAMYLEYVLLYSLDKDVMKLTQYSRSALLLDNN